MIQICLIALVGVFLSLLIKDKNPSIALLLSVACGVMIFISIVGDLSEIISFAEDFSSGFSSGEEISSLLLKARGMGYLEVISADICRDAGENGTAKK